MVMWLCTVTLSKSIPFLSLPFSAKKKLGTRSFEPRFSIGARGEGDQEVEQPPSSVLGRANEAREQDSKHYIKILLSDIGQSQMSAAGHKVPFEDAAGNGRFSANVVS